MIGIKCGFEGIATGFLNSGPTVSFEFIAICYKTSIFHPYFKRISIG
jgi:hypothetical protein